MPDPGAIWGNFDNFDNFQAQPSDIAHISWLGLPKLSSVQFSALFTELWTELLQFLQNQTKNWTEQERTGSQQFCSVLFLVWTG